MVLLLSTLLDMVVLVNVDDRLIVIHVTSFFFRCRLVVRLTHGTHLLSPNELIYTRLHPLRHSSMIPGSTSDAQDDDTHWNVRIAQDRGGNSDVAR